MWCGLFRCWAGALLLLGPAWAAAQDLATYRLTCDPDSFAILYARPTEEIYITASLTYEGQTWNNVQMRIRGDGSRRRPKKSLKLKSEVPFFNGRTTLNFNADYLDPSYMRTVLASLLMQAAGQPAFLAEHAQLMLNGEVLGLYVRVENMDEDFLRARDLDPEGNLYKATLDDASMSIFDNVAVHWEKKAGSGGRGDLQTLIGEINTVPAAEYRAWAQATFDYPLMVNMLALNMLIANGSTYYHNYYLYHDVRASGQWIMLPWDLDFTFSSYGVNYPYHRSSGLANPDNPFLERAMLDPSIRADVQARINELAGTFFNPAYLYPLIDSLQAVIAPAVALDQTDDVPDQAGWQAQIDREKQFIQNRAARLQRQFAEYPTPFQVHRRVVQDQGTLTFSWQPATDPQGNPITYSFLFSTSRRFAEDETTSHTVLTDTTFALPSPLPGTYYWQVSASDGTDTIDGFDTRNRVYVTAGIPPPLFITEVNYNAPPALDTGDWVEVYNPHPVAVDLTGWHLQDSLIYHQFGLDPHGSIPPEGVLIVSRDTAAFRAVHPGVTALVGELDFGFSSMGDAVRLRNPRGDVIDEVPYLPGPPWPSEANGGGATLERQRLDLPGHDPDNWRASLLPGGSPGHAATLATAISSPDAPPPALLLPNYPNPFATSTRLSFRLAAPTRVTLTVYDALGRRVARPIKNQHRHAGAHTIDWHPEGLGAGVYVVELQTMDGPIYRRTILRIY